MKIEIKQALLEGNLPEVIVEAVHANSYSFNKNTAKYNPVIQNNRDILAHNIKLDRVQRDKLRNNTNPLLKVVNNAGANTFDNGARLKSQDDRFGKELFKSNNPTGLIEKDLPYSNEFRNQNTTIPVIKTMLKPRLISSAKQ